MKTKLFLFIGIATFIVVTFMFSCVEYDSCIDRNRIGGLIDSEIYLGKYFNLLDSQTIVVTDINSYESLKKHVLPETNRAASDTFLLPSIDFSKQTLLGRLSTCVGCNTRYNRTVEKNDAQQQYIYTIEIEECGGCEIENISMNWVLVPKIDDDYTIIYKLVYADSTLVTEWKKLTAF